MPHRVAILIFAAVLVLVSPVRATINWRVFPSNFPTDDVIVAAISGDDVGLDKTGATNVTSQLQSLADEVYLAGGGTIFLPQGIYRVDGSVTVKAGVTIRGEWQKPTPGNAITGTFIKVTSARAGQGLTNAGTFNIVLHAGAVRDLAFWYPDQNFNSITAYPPAIQIGKIGGYAKPAIATVLNITFVNAYYGVYLGPGNCGNPNLVNVYGTALKTGVRADSSFGGVSRFQQVDFSPGYWSGSGLAGSPPARTFTSSTSARTSPATLSIWPRSAATTISLISPIGGRPTKASSARAPRAVIPAATRARTKPTARSSPTRSTSTPPTPAIRR